MTVTGPLGIGLAPLGVSPFGFGSPASATPVPVAVLKKADGTQGNVPNIVNGDFVLDDAGQKQGADSVPMMVQLALTTKFNSSAVRGFGVDWSSLTTITTQAADLADKIVRAALKHMTDRKLIAIQRVTLDRRAAEGVNILVEWIDLNTGEADSSTFSPGGVAT